MRRRTKVVLVSGVFAVVCGAWVRLGGLPQAIVEPRTIGTPTFLASDGSPLDAAASRALAAAKGRSSSSRDRGPSLAKQAFRLAAATKAGEDRRFNRHFGVDPVAVVRAFAADLRARRVVQGGSTITQQLVKLRAGPGASGRSAASKLRQAVYALRLEHRMSKDEILSAYLAEAPYGGRMIGAESASEGYFNTSASQLSWAQAAYLASLPQRPSAFNPRRDASAARSRQLWILGRLRSSGTISVEEHRTALAEPLGLVADAFDPQAPHFTEMLAKQVAAAAVRGPFRTTLNARLQHDVVGIARQQRRELRRNHAANVAVVVLDNATGAVRAWEGSGDYFDPDHGGMLNGPMLARQIGSTIKPFIYAAAFDAGAAPGDTIDDTPFETTADGKNFRPQNYDRRFRGPIPMREALASSVNVPAVRLLAKQTPRSLVEMLNRAGIVLPFGPQHYGLALGLGTAEISLLDLTKAYAALARGGRSVDAAFFEPAVNQTGGRRVASEAAAFLIGDVLSDNEARAPAFGRRSALKFGFPVAVKTGTSQNFHDNWVVGYTADFTVGVWVGNFDRTPLAGATGVTGAGPLFHSVMLAAHRRLTPAAAAEIGAPLFPRVPDELVVVPQGARTEYRWVGSRVRTTEAPEKGGQLRLVEPVNGGAYLLDAGRPRDAQRLPLRASGGAGSYTYTVDGVPESGGAWLLRAGRHEVCVLDRSGARRCARFTVS